MQDRKIHSQVRKADEQAIRVRALRAQGLTREVIAVRLGMSVRGVAKLIKRGSGKAVAL